MCLIVFIVVFDDCCFFFFKQKTAYEMLISDWSSDVCSSDLWLAERYTIGWLGRKTAEDASNRCFCRTIGVDYFDPWQSVVKSTNHVCIGFFSADYDRIQ